MTFVRALKKSIEIGNQETITLVEKIRKASKQRQHLLKKLLTFYTRRGL